MISATLPESIRRLDLGAEEIWPPERLDLLDGWRCRLDRGVTRRANSVLPLYWRGRVLGDSVDAAIARYLEAGLAPCFQITDGADPPDLDGLLERRGFRREGASLVLCRPASGPLWQGRGANPTPAPNPEPVAVKPAYEAAWLDCLHRETVESHKAIREAILQRIAGPLGFASLLEDRRVVAVGLGALADQVGWFNCMHTDPTARRRGYAGAILCALMAWLREAGAQWFSLQVEADNAAARGLYESARFELLYRYHYRVLR